MKTTLTFILALSIISVFGQTKVLSLENNTGIIEDSLGSVTLWENQIEGYGDATQPISSLGGDKLYETYPGKVNVGFSKDGSSLTLDGTSTSVADNAYSFFYVGKANPTGKTACLAGNYDIEGNWSKISGSRFIKLKDGSIAIQYGTPNLKTHYLSVIPGEGYFFFGYTMDVSGNYKYFDNNSSLIKEGKLDATIKPNDGDFVLNIYDDKTDGPMTYAHTEVVELSMYDGLLSDADFAAEYVRLTTDYADLVTADFSITEVLPAERTNLPVASPLSLIFDQSVDTASVFPIITINKSATSVSGEWVISPSNVLTFTPTENWPANALVNIQVIEGLLSTDSVEIDLSKGTSYNFIVETDGDFGAAELIDVPTIATVDFPQVGHNLDIKLTLPTNRTKKMPIHFWIHGGGWSGGTAESSGGSYSPHGEYLAENLGVASLGVAYRCTGSSGNFTLAMEDIMTAYQWALDNADTYNFDTTRVFFSGGSAGTPLASLASQRIANVVGFIGFNGKYDFVNEAGSWGQNNWFGQKEPSAEANSAIFNLRSNPPATIMMHGEDDTTIPYTQSTLFADAINAAGGEAVAIIYPGEVHAFFNPGKPAYEDVLIEMANFIREILKDTESTAMGEGTSNTTKLIAYPNPITKGGILNVCLNSKFSKGALDIQVINYVGQTVLQTSNIPDLASHTLSLDVKDLEQGYYIVRLSKDEYSEAFNFIIQ